MIFYFKLPGFKLANVTDIEFPWFKSVVSEIKSFQFVELNK